jgi:hypothetical protein
VTRTLRMLAVGLLALAAVLVPAAPASGTRAAAADDIYALVNQARWANGQPGLIRNSAMDQVAANWAATMASNGTMAHNPDYASQIPGGWTGAAENVAQGHPSGTAMHNGWMGSSGHRANILGNYTDIGIAFLVSGGTTWGVQVFGRYPGHSGPANPAPPPPPPPAPPAPEPPTASEVTPGAPGTTPSNGEPASPGDESDATPAAEPTRSATPTRTPAPRETATTEVVTFTRPDEAPPVSPVWSLAVLVGAVTVAAATAWVVRRRRAG